MPNKTLLEGKKILIVDDEPDIIETLEQLLSICKIAKASTFEEAKEKLESQFFDLAILDIMGVYGYDLLRIAKDRNVIAVMLTAHAPGAEYIAKSFMEGAAFHVPKEEMHNIAIFLNDILEAKEKGESFWSRWVKRLGPYYDRKLGSDWKDKHKEIWRKIQY